MYMPVLIDKSQLNRVMSEGKLHEYLRQLFSEYSGTEFEFCEVIINECSKEISYLDDMEEKLKMKPPTDSIFSTRDRNQTIMENLETIRDRIIIPLRNRIVYNFENSIYSDKLKSWYELAGSYYYSNKGFTDANGEEKVLSVYPDKNDIAQIELFNKHRIKWFLDVVSKNSQEETLIKPLDVLINDFHSKVEFMALPTRRDYAEKEIVRCNKFRSTNLYESYKNKYGVIELSKIHEVIEQPLMYIIVYSTEKYLEFLEDFKNSNYQIKSPTIKLNKTVPDFKDCFVNYDDFLKILKHPQIEELYNFDNATKKYIWKGAKTELAGFAFRLRDSFYLLDNNMSGQDLAKLFCPFFNVKFNSKEEKQFQPDRAKEERFKFIKQRI